MQEYSFKTFVTESTERYVYQTKSEHSTVTAALCRWHIWILSLWYH